MATFYRIQPAGLGLNHESEDSAGECNSLHVFDSMAATLNCEGRPTDYGDEVVEIEAPRSWENGDVEGVAINPATARIVARYTLNEFAAMACPEVASLDTDDVDATLAYAGCELWYAALHK